MSSAIFLLLQGGSAYEAGQWVGRAVLVLLAALVIWAVVKRLRK